MMDLKTGMSSGQDTGFDYMEDSLSSNSEENKAWSYLDTQKSIMGFGRKNW